ncbi:DNA gyrase inhibitor YacG [Marinobacterium weihaiense]|uniref:DNA gyrase inhibitor YacG n=1 Tax=Marinobacterium weihaiense TaxID=2851016 RepID=A0ABS6M9Q3_9GAMM|nr:DNA gyrase inhibitor YacG [Marinobacterium weihaiense]MBV0933005.1 DNA gyrase inhibitor YacG [Marinobacterium weihaiense]
MTDKTVKCPQCGEPARYAADNKWRPFCSERCRLIDLGEWASESYQIAAEPSLDEFSSGMTAEEMAFTPTRH